MWPSARENGIRIALTTPSGLFNNYSTSVRWIWVGYNYLLTCLQLSEQSINRLMGFCHRFLVQWFILPVTRLKSLSILMLVRNYLANYKITASYRTNISSKALYQTTKIKFEKLLGWQVFKNRNRTIARWRHLTTTTRIVEFVVFLCKLRLLFCNPQRDWQI